MLVTPGFVDIIPTTMARSRGIYLSPSSWHGVTTLVMGNCGVGFAPVAPGQQEFLIGLMEGVEDIPGTALNEGIKWSWESFPQYLDAIEKMPRVIDIGAQVPHGAVRAYVMGERGAHNEEATEDDIAKMAALVRDAIKAGALGFSTSRTMLHRAKNKEVVPGTFASEAELLGLGRALAAAGHGVFEMASDMTGPDATMEWMIKLTRETGLPITFAMGQADHNPDGWRVMLDRVKRYNADGAHLAPQISPRPTGMLMGLQSSLHPFITHPTYHRELAHLPLEERLAQLKRPEVRPNSRRRTRNKGSRDALPGHQFRQYFRLGDPPDYEPAPRPALPPARSVRPQPRGIDLRFDARTRWPRDAHMPFPLRGIQPDAVRDDDHTTTTLGLSDGARIAD